VVVLDRQRGQLDIRVAQRLPLGMTFDRQLDRLQAIIDRLGSVHGQPELDGGVKVAIDATGLGRPVLELAQRKLRQWPTGVIITGGSTASVTGSLWRVPKEDLVGATSVALQNRRLHAARQLPDLVTLLDELKAFSYEATTAGTSYGNDARAGHDDMVVALMLAAYLSERSSYTPVTDATSRYRRRGAVPYTDASVEGGAVPWEGTPTFRAADFY
jgi:hypothetical protein